MPTPHKFPLQPARYKHKGKYKHKCDQCEFSTSSSKRLALHQSSVHQVEQSGGVQEASLQCDQCDHVAVNMAGLKQHWRTKHRRLSCDICEFLPSDPLRLLSTETFQG